MSRTARRRAENRVVQSLLREMRERAGLTQKELAERLDLVPSYISKIERGERRVTAVELHHLCIACGSSGSAFMRRLSEGLKALTH